MLCIKNNLNADEKLSKIIVQAVGRPYVGYQYVNKLKEANVPMADDVIISVYNGRMFSAAMSNWGEMSAAYVVEKV